MAQFSPNILQITAYQLVICHSERVNESACGAASHQRSSHAARGATANEKNLPKRVIARSGVCDEAISLAVADRDCFANCARNDMGGYYQDKNLIPTRRESSLVMALPQ
jgi:hypothetical protein